MKLKKLFNAVVSFRHYKDCGLTRLKCKGEQDAAMTMSKPGRVARRHYYIGLLLVLLMSMPTMFGMDVDQPSRTIVVGGSQSKWSEKTIIVPTYIINLAQTLRDLVDDVQFDTEPIPLPGVANISPQVISEFFEYLKTIAPTTDEKVWSPAIKEEFSKKIRALVHEAANKDIQKLKKAGPKVSSKEWGLKLIGNYIDLANYLSMDSVLPPLCQGLAEVIANPELATKQRSDLTQKIMQYVNIPEIRELIVSFLEDDIKKSLIGLNSEKLLQGMPIKLTSNVGYIYSIAFSPDSLTLASGGDDSIIRIWDVKTGKEVHQLTGHAGRIASVAFSPDGLILASGGDDNTIRIWDVKTGKEVRQLTGHTDRIWSVAFSPDGLILASGGNNKTVHIWDVKTGKEIHQLTGHANRIWSVAFSPDGLILASGGDDKTVRIWDVKTGKEIHQWTGHTDRIASVAFSPDGLQIGYGSRKGVYIWNLLNLSPQYLEDSCAMHFLVSLLLLLESAA